MLSMFKLLVTTDDIGKRWSSSNTQNNFLAFDSGIEPRNQLVDRELL